MIEYTEFTKVIAFKIHSILWCMVK